MIVKVHAIGINPLDILIRQASFGLVSLPHILGEDAAGEVEEVGRTVTNFKVL